MHSRTFWGSDHPLHQYSRFVAREVLPGGMLYGINLHYFIVRLQLLVSNFGKRRSNPLPLVHHGLRESREHMGREPEAGKGRSKGDRNGGCKGTVLCLYQPALEKPTVQGL